MPKIDYAALRQATLELIDDATDATSGLVTIRRISQGAPGATPWKPAAPTVTDEVVPAVVTEPSEAKRREGDSREGAAATLVAQAAYRVLIADAAMEGAAPTTADLVVIAGSTYKVLAVETVAPGGVALLHKLEVGA